MGKVAEIINKIHAANTAYIASNSDPNKGELDKAFKELNEYLRANIAYLSSEAFRDIEDTHKKQPEQKFHINKMDYFI